MKRFFIILATLITAMSYGMTSTTVELKVNAEGLVTPPPKAPYRSRNFSYHQSLPQSLSNQIAKRHKQAWTSPASALTAMREPLKTFFEYKPKLELPTRIDELPSQALLANRLLQLDNTEENKKLIEQMGLPALQTIFFDYAQFHTNALKLPVKINEPSTLSNILAATNTDQTAEVSRQLKDLYFWSSHPSNARMTIAGGRVHFDDRFIQLQNWDDSQGHNTAVRDTATKSHIITRKTYTENEIRYKSCISPIIIWEIDTQNRATEMARFNLDGQNDLQGINRTNSGPFYDQPGQQTTLFNPAGDQILIAYGSNIELRTLHGKLIAKTSLATGIYYERSLDAKNPILQARFSPDGRHILAVSLDPENEPGHKVHILKLSGNKLLPCGSFPWTGEVSFNAASNLMAMGCGKTAIVRNLDGTELMRYHLPHQTIRVVFHPDNPDTIVIYPISFEVTYEGSIHANVALFEHPTYYNISWLNQIEQPNANQKALLLELDAQFKANTSWIRQRSIVLTENQKVVFQSFAEPLREHLIKNYKIDLTQTALPPIAQEQQITSSSNSTSSNKGIFMGIGLGLAALAGSIYWYMKGR